MIHSAYVQIVHIEPYLFVNHVICICCVPSDGWHTAPVSVCRILTVRKDLEHTDVIILYRQAESAPSAVSVHMVCPPPPPPLPLHSGCSVVIVAVIFFAVCELDDDLLVF